jgi:hypothetical protein
MRSPARLRTCERVWSHAWVGQIDITFFAYRPPTLEPPSGLPNGLVHACVQRSPRRMFGPSQHMEGMHKATDGGMANATPIKSKAFFFLLLLLRRTRRTRRTRRGLGEDSEDSARIRRGLGGLGEDSARTRRTFGEDSARTIFFSVILFLI